MNRRVTKVSTNPPDSSHHLTVGGKTSLNLKTLDQLGPEAWWVEMEHSGLGACPRVTFRRNGQGTQLSIRSQILLSGDFSLGPHELRGPSRVSGGNIDGPRMSSNGGSQPQCLGQYWAMCRGPGSQTCNKSGTSPQGTLSGRL